MWNLRYLHIFKPVKLKDWWEATNKKMGDSENWQEKFKAIDGI